MYIQKGIFHVISSSETRIFRKCAHKALPLDPTQIQIKWVLTLTLMFLRQCCNSVLLTTPVSTKAFVPSSSSGHIFVFIFIFCRTCWTACQSNAPCFLHPIST